MNEHQPDLYLEFCRRTDPRYKNIRKNHYVPDRGNCGQQIHFLVWYNRQVIGIISGASAVMGTKLRDDFFGLTESNKQFYLNGIIDNVLFRTEYEEDNLGTRILALWRRAAVHVWEDLYAVKVFGFETFIDEERFGDPKEKRDGALYKADNWYVLGMTDGNTKQHGNGGLNGGGIGTPSIRRSVPRKLVACRWLDPSNPYQSHPRIRPAGGTKQPTKRHALDYWENDAKSTRVKSFLREAEPCSLGENPI